VYGQAAGARLILNEWADTRAEVLAGVFPGVHVHRKDAESLDDRLDPGLVPSVVLMNPPFSAAAHVQGRLAGQDYRHVRSALARLAPGGRLVAITGERCDTRELECSDDVRAYGKVRFTCAVDGKVFRRHGTTITTRLTVIDKICDDGVPTLTPAEVGSVQELLTALAELQGRAPVTWPDTAETPTVKTPSLVTRRTHVAVPAASPAPSDLEQAELAYVERPQVPELVQGEGERLYEPYAPERILITGATPHPTKLVQSAAMASVRPPMPSYKPHLPPRIAAEGLLSDAQLESVVYAGQAHASLLQGFWLVNETYDSISPVAEGTPLACRFRRGWFLGDGTGAGKGRQVAGILLDNWLKGRHKAVWISKSDKLLEDAQRDWSALAQEKLLVVPQDRYRQGRPITLREGILFTTYATLRSGDREGKVSRLQQILDWVGCNFDGVIVFDEAHAMANAASSKGTRGIKGPSQQGLAGLKIQHALPDARVLYVSATGATTVENLAYAQRMGLWGNTDLPFESRQDFVAAMEKGGIASSEVLARDLKALGLYCARSLSYEGVEVDILEHGLTAEQISIYDAFARAYQMIHSHLDAALEASGVTRDGSTLNPTAKSTAKSAFEGSKQRFFAHLITAMKMPTLIAAMRSDLVQGRAVVVQLVSTSEALMERRLAHIPQAEWGDLSVDITPREYVLDYLAHSFPTQLHETYSDDDGNLLSRPVYEDGRAVHCRDAEARRDAMIEHLAALPPVQAALDNIIQSFGTEVVAEVTGRGRRIVRKQTVKGTVLAVENRPGSSNLAETQAFMDDRKQILVFSDAGGTGRSYHADLTALNQRPRVHYLLEAGWKADSAIQGLGRSNRTNQKQPPLFRPVATDVRGEKRFLSTIARRLDSLGAITKGQR
ncbi:MAG: strawberry notch-like NTP hydrolase domain-containing protein, partial [Hyphomicrobium sp.]